MRAFGSAGACRRFRRSRLRRDRAMSMDSGRMTCGRPSRSRIGLTERSAIRQSVRSRISAPDNHCLGVDQRAACCMVLTDQPIVRPPDHTKADRSTKQKAFSDRLCLPMPHSRAVRRAVARAIALAGRNACYSYTVARPASDRVGIGDGNDVAYDRWRQIQLLSPHLGLERFGCILQPQIASDLRYKPRRRRRLVHDWYCDRRCPSNRKHHKCEQCQRQKPAEPSPD